jgi:hypothetical protein
VFKLHKEQGGICPLCQRGIDLKIKGEAVMDHCHETGLVRGILHRSCNAAEGKVANAAGRWGAKTMDYESGVIPYLENLVAYLKRPKHNLIYPSHLTPEEQKDKANLKRRSAAAAKKAVIAAKGL